MSVSNCSFSATGGNDSGNLYECLVPAPRKVELSAGWFDVTKITGVSAPTGLEIHTDRLTRTGRHLHLALHPDPSGNLKLNIYPSLPLEAWSLRVTGDSIELCGGSAAAVGYGTGALRQLLAISAERGLAEARLPCGMVEDSPEFAWRGFLLDSVRHMQHPETIIRLLSVLAEFRINVFHWHLTDDISWRINVGSMCELCENGNGFSLDEIRRITSHAARLGISIVPEIDVPGHSTYLLKRHPEFACCPEHPGREFCLGNPAGREFIKKLLTDVAAIFPDSRYIHVGGDESETTAWEHCTRCSRALHAAGYTDFRKLEQNFMNEIINHVYQLGKTPILWGTGEFYDVGTIIQPWTHLSELRRFAEHGNQMINSICGNFYLDYPATPAEVSEQWMMTLSEETLYRTSPCPFWGKDIQEKVLGCEGCLWTEILPEWRIMAKLRPRLAALSEVAWGKLPNADYFDYLRRRMHLDAAGYWELISAISE